MSAPAPMKFLVFEDNGAAFHWAIVTASGDQLVRSAGFASYQEAKQASGVVRRGAGSATFEERLDNRATPAFDAARLELATARLELAGRGELATVRDDLDAERWLDEGHGLNSEAASTWPPLR
jgi:uncharacterized protein YegP (UPF0339 family)